MCIAIYKPADVDFLDKETYNRCWRLNPDGASISVWRPDEQLWEVTKGLMEFETWWETFSAMKDKETIRPEDQVFIHFRVGTAGPKLKAGFTHPFPLCDDYKNMVETYFKAENIVGHNGTIARGDDDRSDTMWAVKKFIYPVHGMIYDLNGEVVNPELEYIMEHCLDTAMSRWFITVGEMVWLYGPWKEHEGTHFSNEDYKPATYGYRYGAYSGSGAAFGYAVNRRPAPATYYRHGDITPYLTDGEWDWEKWDKNGNAKSTNSSKYQSQNNKPALPAPDQGEETSTPISMEDLLVAIVDELGNIEWQDNYMYDAFENTACPNCGCLDIKEDYTDYIGDARCPECGTNFDAMTGENFGIPKDDEDRYIECSDDISDDLTTETWDFCVICQKAVHVDPINDTCSECGKPMDPDVLARIS